MMRTDISCSESHKLLQGLSRQPEIVQNQNTCCIRQVLQCSRLCTAHRAVDLAEGEGDVFATLAGRKFEAGHQLAGVAGEGSHTEGHEERRDLGRLQERRADGRHVVAEKVSLSCAAMHHGPQGKHTPRVPPTGSPAAWWARCGGAAKQRGSEGLCNNAIIEKNPPWRSW